MLSLRGEMAFDLPSGPSFCIAGSGDLGGFYDTALPLVPSQLTYCRLGNLGDRKETAVSGLTLVLYRTDTSLWLSFLVSFCLMCPLLKVPFWVTTSKSSFSYFVLLGLFLMPRRKLLAQHVRSRATRATNHISLSQGDRVSWRRHHRRREDRVRQENRKTIESERRKRRWYRLIVSG